MPGRLQKLALVWLLLFPAIFAGSTANQPHPRPLETVPPASVPKVIDTGRFRVSPASAVNVRLFYSTEPAPMGVADYGVGPSGAYEYSTNSSLGAATIVSLSARNSTGNPLVTVQLNVNLQFYNNNKPFVYWVQNVAFLDTATNEVQILDNIWNSTTLTAVMSAGAVSGKGQVYRDASQFYYAAEAGFSIPGNLVNLVYPSTLELRVNSSMNAAKQPVVTFEYNDGYGWQDYDSVAFTAVRQLTSLTGFVVNGFDYKPDGFFDSELILGGPGGGEQTSDVSSDVRLQLEYYNGHNYQSITNAYNYGSDTAEGISNTSSQYSYVLANGGVIADVTAGAGSLGTLWQSSQVSILDIQTPFPSGTLDVANASSVAGTAAQYPFKGGEVTVTIQPGTYNLQLFQGAALSSTGKYTVASGQLLKLKAPLGLIPLTLSYSVVGGGSGFSPPQLTYTSNGAVQHAALGTSPTVYELDSGSSWSVAAELVGSTTSERWQAAQPPGGSASGAQALSLVFFHQYLETFGYSVEGGGSGYSPPAVSGQQFGASYLVSLGSSPAVAWLDSGSSYAGTNPLPGSTPSERWFASSGQGTVNGPSSVSLTYSHQYALTVSGGASPATLFFNSGAQAIVSQPSVYGRSAGTGQRVVSYSLDGGPQDDVLPSLGNFTVTVPMSSPSTLSITSVTQYQVSLDATSAQGLGSISPPTVSGDGYWYDSGSKVDVTLNGAWGRSAGTGIRLASFAVNGAQTQANAAGPVTVLSLASISAPEMLTAKSVSQFFLNYSSGAVASITPPSIGGDSGWYDSQTVVSARFNYTWGAIQGESRLNAISFSVDGGPSTALTRQGSGTFGVMVTMNQAHTVGVSSVRQYRFAVSSGSHLVLSAMSPTSDGYYDGNSTVRVTTDDVWNVTSGQQRLELTGYSLDGEAFVVPRNASGTFTTPEIVFNTYHSLSLLSVEQYYISFSFTDSSGRTITPSSLSIDDQGSQTVLAKPVFEVWLDNGSSFTISDVLWEGVDVKPEPSTVYSVASPSSIPVELRVYDATLKVVGYLGDAIAGADVRLDVANGSSIAEKTGQAGTATFAQIPLGTFNATVSSLGFTSQVSGDASSGQTIVVKSVGSFLGFGAVGLGILAALLAVYIALRRKPFR